MKRSGIVVIVGGGGREHALARKLQSEKGVAAVHAWPGNAGMASDGIVCHESGDTMDFEGLGAFAVSVGAEMVVVGPEGPLVGGIANYFKKEPRLKGITLVGPSKEGARLEGSKSYAKRFMHRYGIPTARYQSFDASEAAAAESFLATMRAPYVIKADGLAAGKGVSICQTLDEARTTLRSYFDGKFAEAGRRVVIEEFLEGTELSVFVITDGRGGYVILPEAKDYKRIGEGDTGLNTGGMGAVSPVPFADERFMKSVIDGVVTPTLNGIKAEGLDYSGFIFFGLIRLKDGRPSVIEYNVRMGDPETQVVLPRLNESLYQLFHDMKEGTLGRRSAKCAPNACVTVTLAADGYPGIPQKGKLIEIERGAIPSDGHLIYSGVSNDEDGLLRTNGGRVISACGTGATITAATACAYKTARSVHFDGEYMRRDIAQDVI